ncbi:MAG TPA: hypothetical protein P5052_01580 [Candidatus Paceibacterota bacterium]|nr:hypothetical protein [Candidatus Paceibacterota bacterium]HRZ29454.1 hypothetical protein [Candidatus Paceibacterota bacterium]
MPQTARIVDGPGKFDLMLSLFDNKVLMFELEGGQQVPVRVLSIRKEDGSGENWKLKGVSTKSGKDLKIYYSTRRNEGTVSRE